MFLCLLTLIISCGDEGGAGSGSDVGRPEITGVSPESGFVGDEVTITAGGLVPQPEDNIVRFNGTRAAVKDVTRNQLITAVPEGATSGTITLEVVGGIAKGPFFTVLTPTPTITSIMPTSGRPGTRVTITGTNFGGAPAASSKVPAEAGADSSALSLAAPGPLQASRADTTAAPVITEDDISVTVGGVEAEIISRTSTRLVIKIPQGAADGPIVITIGGQSVNSGDFDITFDVVTPEITGIAPASGMPGTAVTISGANFGATLGDNIVTFNGAEAAISSATENEIVATVPDGATTGPVAVTVGEQTATSQEDFTVQHNQPPAITSEASFDVAENSTTVGTITATDPNGDDLTYSISGGDDKSQFSIDGNSGALTFTTAPNFENPADANTDNMYQVNVSVSDGSQTATQPLTITVTDVDENQAPTITSGASFEVAENSTAVGTITATDPNGDDLTFSLSGGDDQGLFSINDASGALSFDSAPDFENPADANTDNMYLVEVQVSDGTETATQPLTITVTDVNENEAPTITSEATFNVAENSTAVGTITASDPNGDDLTFSLSGGDDQNQFSIDGSSGALTFTTAPDFESPGDAGSDNVYQVSVSVSDGTETATQPLTITVTDVDENQAPSITSEATFSVAENSTSVGTITATDPNGDDLSFSISGGDDQGLFTINTTGGALEFTTAPDFENPTDTDKNNTYLVQVSASDGTSSATQPLTITVTDVNENQAPSITSGASFTATEGQKVATTITATDPNGDELTFSLSGGTDQDDFSIDATTGVLSFLVAPNFARPTDSDSDNIYNVSVQVSDNNLTASQDLTITVPFPFTGGDGTAGNPYQVANLTQLQRVGDFLDKNFLQTANIDASATANNSYGDGKGFAPMGSNITPFTGTYNGNGFTISGLTINRPSTRLVGIFGLVGGNIEDVGVIDANITGGNETGGLAGFNSGSITDSYATGSVTGGSNTAGLVGRNSGGAIKRSYATATIVGSANAGGLVGTNGESGTIADAYATGSVTGGDFNTGGLVGANTSTIFRSYATGAVISSGRFIGGLVGAIGGTSTSTDSYWDTQTTGQATSNGGTGLTTAEMVGNTAQTTNMTGFDFSGVWKTNATYYPTLQDNPQANLPVLTPNQPPSITSGVSFTATEGQTAVATITASDPENNTLTYSISGGLDAGDFSIGSSSGALAFTRAPDYDNPTDSNTDNAYEVKVSVSDGSASDTKTLSIIVPPFAGGNGTSSTPYQVATLTQLQRVGQVVLSNFVQTQDIDASPTSNASYGDGNGFAPIGDGSNKFSGSYNGDGFTISGLTINRPSTNYVGLFGYTNSGASLTDVALTGADITGSTNTGGLAGANQGSITGSYATGSVTVTGSDINIGGLAGSNSGSITGSYATANVSINDFSGTANAGGLVGINTNTIENSYATGSVTGAFNCGGLVGTNQGSITNAYATGRVTGGPEIGGLVSQGTGGTITDSYWDTETTGLPGSSGDPGLNTAQMIGSAAQTNMTGFDFSGTWKTNASFYPTLRANPQPNLPVITPNRAPSITSGSSFTATEGQTAVTTITATDPDMDALTYAITGGVDSGDFSIGRSNGDLSFASAPDADNPADSDTDNEYIVQVQVSDGTQTDSQTMTITVPLYAGGNGTSGNPYQVATLAQLQRVNNDLSGYYEQIANVDASSTQNSSYGDGSGFLPIGNGSTFFTGSYDGADFTISGLTINRPTTTYVGLFGVIGSNPGVENVHLTGVDITGQNNTGALAGTNAGTISGSSASGSVSGTDRTGGLAGTNAGGSSITASSASSTVSGSGNTGGLAGYNEASGTITTSYATGDVSSTGDGTGGLAGSNEGTIADTYATGDVTASDAGGLVGENGNTIRRSYATGAVSGGGAHPGGLVSSDDFTDDSYWDIETTGQSSSAGGTGLNTAQMIGSAATMNMTGFDFTGVWTTNASFYPTLRDNPQANLPVITPNQPPSITSGVSFTATEGQTAVTTITATDPDMDALTYSIIGGDDSGDFSIGSSGGALAFNTAPDFANPTDSDMDNIYQVQIQVSDGAATDAQSLTIPVPSPFAGGSGTVGAPYQITTLTQLQRVGDFLDSHFIQTAHIDASATANASYGDGNGFDPIGDFGNQFTGSYDGAGFTISGLTIDRPGQNDVGLFGAIDNGSGLEDVQLTGLDVTGGGRTGGLAGRNDGSITNSSAGGAVSGTGNTGGLVGLNIGPITGSSAGTTVTGTSGTGGLVGRNSGTSGTAITGSHATGSVTGGNRTGGLVGGNNNTITDSYATGNVTGADETGGLVGVYNSSNPITGSYATGTVNGSNSVGGLVGKVNNGTVTHSYANGNVTGTGTSTGGLVGTNEDFVTDAYATGTVNGNSLVGGLVGVNDIGGTIRRSYAVGAVSGTSVVGGLAGANINTITDSYWDTITTGQATSVGGTGLITAHMQAAAETNMTGFDFSTVWQTQAGGYPILRGVGGQ